MSFLDYFLKNAKMQKRNDLENEATSSTESFFAEETAETTIATGKKDNDNLVENNVINEIQKLKTYIKTINLHKN